METGLRSQLSCGKRIGGSGDGLGARPKPIGQKQTSGRRKFWESVRIEGDLPDYNVFSPEDLKPLLGHFAIIKSSGADFRYRLYGS